MRGMGNYSMAQLQGQQNIYIMHFSSEVYAMNCNYIVLLKMKGSLRRSKRTYSLSQDDRNKRAEEITF